jgi:3-methylfumaryl-CoA hydratase
LIGRSSGKREGRGARSGVPDLFYAQSPRVAKAGLALDAWSCALGKRQWLRSHDVEAESVETNWNDWVGRNETRSDRVTAMPVAALAATLDRDDPFPVEGDALPPLWHWLYCLPLCRQSEVGPDGHAKRGGFLPPVPLPRRMWAGGRFTFAAPLRIGDEITRTSRIAAVTAKEGRSGPLVFVVVRHELASPRGVAIVEEHDIVYRAAAKPGEQATDAAPAPLDGEWSRDIRPDPVLLFRYSALTFNGHRIHYDRSYATQTEGYPGLVVHGPLIATLLVDLLRRERPDARLAAFAFRAVSALYDTAPFSVHGRMVDETSARLWASSAAGVLAMDATATLA